MWHSGEDSTDENSTEHHQRVIPSNCGPISRKFPNATPQPPTVILGGMSLLAMVLQDLEPNEGFYEVTKLCGSQHLHRLKIGPYVHDKQEEQLK